MGRYSSTEAILGKDLFEKTRNTRLLVVGAGGIGCELLKNLVLFGFKNIEIIDLDTIDLSNLNRQFLFRKADISKPKSIVAAATARHFNPSSGIEIHARHGNVKDSENDVAWIQQFGLVMNALDNMDARKHVNRLCRAAGVPLVESGTTGYDGQVAVYVPGQTDCYECETKNTPKTFPVCTIRSTPSEPIHCIVWGKSYLFGKLFGEDDEELDEAELNKAKEEGENADEIENLRKEAQAFREVRRMLGEEDGPQRVFRKVFHEDINRLLAMEDMWKKEGRIKPVALDYDAIMDGTFVAPPPRALPAGQAVPANGAANGSTPSAVLKDQQELSLKDNLDLFIDSCKRLSARAIAHPEIILSFDKDDDDTLDFVLAVANLRAIAYSIPTKTRFQVKEMAGNIIPAIATTNAIVAGLIVMRAIAFLKGNVGGAFCGAPDRPVSQWPSGDSNPQCSVCNNVYVTLKVDPTQVTLGQFNDEVVKKWLAPSIEDDELEVIIMEGGRLLADPDFDDNLGRTLADLDVTRGKTLTVIDEDSKYMAINFNIVKPDANSATPFDLPEQPPVVPHRPAPAPVEKPHVNTLEEDSFEVVETAPEPTASPTTTKKRRASVIADEEANGADTGSESSKKRKIAPPPAAAHEGNTEADAIEID